MPILLLGAVAACSLVNVLERVRDSPVGAPGGGSGGIAATLTSSDGGLGGISAQGGTGGSGGGGGAAAMSDCGQVEVSCCDCIAVDCKDEHTTCAATPGCFDLLDCLMGCNLPACRAICQHAYAAAAIEALLLEGCAATSCPNECPDAAPLDACKQCALAKCEAAAEACYASLDCRDIELCLLACADDACGDACIAKYPAGWSLLLKAIGCATQMCPECA